VRTMRQNIDRRTRAAPFDVSRDEGALCVGKSIH
jgi:hypothetical protein